MFTICVWFGNQQSPWAFLYDTADKAETQMLQYTANDHPQVEFKDDHGQRMVLQRHLIHGVLIEDLKKSALGKIEISLHGQRTQAQFQSRASSDPTLRLNGAPMIQPMGLGGAFRQ